jgi:hypothetical protein
MAGHLRFVGFFLLLLGIVAAGRLAMGAAGVPYEKGHHVFSIVILTTLSCIYYGAFLRRFQGYRLFQAIAMGFLLGLLSQVVILTLTLLSYVLGMSTYFNHPAALNLPPGETATMGRAMLIRSTGLVGNAIFGSIAGGLGWAMGALLPEK